MNQPSVVGTQAAAAVLYVHLLNLTDVRAVSKVAAAVVSGGGGEESNLQLTH
jgi:hypothetical protein